METPRDCSHQNAPIIKVVKVARCNQYRPGARYVFQSFNYQFYFAAGNHPNYFIQNQHRYALEERFPGSSSFLGFSTWVKKENERCCDNAKEYRHEIRIPTPQFRMRQ